MHLNSEILRISLYPCSFLIFPFFLNVLCRCFLWTVETVPIPSLYSMLSTGWKGQLQYNIYYIKNLLFFLRCEVRDYSQRCRKQQKINNWNRNWHCCNYLPFVLAFGAFRRQFICCLTLHWSLLCWSLIIHP